ncbi:MAG: YggS family pyridoxal phosphate-dependent enzyme [Saprospiraceae bacterium]|jgi:pyridoxal phosphate enzyme (YggS family)|nr:YggS family pyridoxal phosphate-dependent enzyme [Saprospiraceae bacterium]
MYTAVLEAARERNVTLVAVSKMRNVDDIMSLYLKGQRIFGENRVQELLPKYEALPKDIQWHLIGHLQSNKVKYIASFIDTIHSVDSLALLQTIEKEAARHNRTIRVLLQFHIANEETKYGLNETEAKEILEYVSSHPMPHLVFAGVMGMATFTDNANQVRKEFASLASIFSRLKDRFFTDDVAFRHLSMGMSGDYDIAMEEGATMIRVGSALFVHS